MAGPISPWLLLELVVQVQSGKETVRLRPAARSIRPPPHLTLSSVNTIQSRLPIESR